MTEELHQLPSSALLSKEMICKKDRHLGYIFMQMFVSSVYSRHYCAIGCYIVYIFTTPDLTTPTAAAPSSSTTTHIQPMATISPVPTARVPSPAMTVTNIPPRLPLLTQTTPHLQPSQTITMVGNSEPPASRGLSGGEIAAIVITLLLLFLLAASAIVIVIMKIRKKKSKELWSKAVHFQLVGIAR